MSVRVSVPAAFSETRFPTQMKKRPISHVHSSQWSDSNQRPMQMARLYTTTPLYEQYEYAQNQPPMPSLYDPASRLPSITSIASPRWNSEPAPVEPLPSTSTAARLLMRLQQRYLDDVQVVYEGLKRISEHVLYETNEREVPSSDRQRLGQALLTFRRLLRLLHRRPQDMSDQSVRHLLAVEAQLQEKVTPLSHVFRGSNNDPANQYDAVRAQRQEVLRALADPPTMLNKRSPYTTTTSTGSSPQRYAERPMHTDDATTLSPMSMCLTRLLSDS